jgi:putative FmdB family regulatory protein
MPTYQYQCKNCGFMMEELQSIKAAPLTRCPQCNTDALARIMGTGVNLIFKGSGFYQTDYKKSGSPEVPAKKAPASEGKTTPGEDKKSTKESKKSESGPTAKPKDSSST